MKKQNKQDKSLDVLLDEKTNKTSTQKDNKDINKTAKVSKTKAGKNKTEPKLPEFTYKNLIDDNDNNSVQSENAEDTKVDNKENSNKGKPQKKSKKKTTSSKDNGKSESADTKKKKKFNTRSFVSMLILFVLGISSGLFAGNWYATNFIAGPPTDYSLYTESELRAGNDKIASEYASKVPTSNTAWKSFVAAESNFASASTFDILSNGVVDTIVTQSVYSRKIYDGEKVYVEQISDGMVAVADRFIYEPSKYILEDKATHIVRTKGKLGDPKTINDHLTCNFNCKHGNKNAYTYNTNYNGAVTTMTEDEYVEALGGLPLSPVAYIVSEKTVLSCGNFKVVGSGDNTRYTFTLSLHSGASVLNYVKQMKTVSGLSAYPNFTEVNLNVSLQMLDGKVMFDYICINEKYSVAYGSLTPKCTGTLHQRFLFNGDYEIPA